ncbi:bridge-like lipid transfer protein family member 3B isoform X3 [Oratosquilla oratoria]|uniref:bridge-like lipid transfer protein family member 3B isoform X3 n=1 Tax=Oratosquilla oratoria TaxID=337810 RepID=UPI003F760DE7
MAGLIKSQILKHLSKFAKNLSSDSVNVSTLRGEGELSNLELNEHVLTELLELPTWLRITQASVNKVNIKIQWTKLKSVPITLTLDEVILEMETCSELRPMSGHTTLPSYTSGGKYGFSDKVIDGMTVTVNSVIIMFKSHAFHASFQLSRIVLDSKSPTWQGADLRMTRLKDPDRGELLIFKEVTWQTLKIEAKSTNDLTLTPLRLITNHATCRITLKKKLSDCSVLGCRLVLIMDDLLWVLTDSQLIAAFHFLDSLSGLIQKATEMSQKIKAARKLESLPDILAQQAQQARGSSGMSTGCGGGGGGGGGGGMGGAARTNIAPSNITRVFKKYDVIETSYHFYSERIDLHFCDDPGPGRSSHPELATGAALQVTVCQLQVDYYPYHLAAGERVHWIKYSDCSPAKWAQDALGLFRTRLTDTLSANKSSHTPLARAPPHTRHESASQGASPKSTSSPSSVQGTPHSSPHKSAIATQLRKLMSSCAVLRIMDFSVYKVTTAKRKQSPKEFISGDKDRFSLPANMTSIHIEFTLYYYPGFADSPVPPPKMYIQCNPMQINLDPLSVLWLNAFTMSLQQAIQVQKASASSSSSSYVDIYLEAIMPRVIVESTTNYQSQRDRPKSMHIQTSRLVLTNTRPPDPTSPGSLASLAAILETIQQGELFFGSHYPSKPGDFQPICDKFMQHATVQDNVREPPNVSQCDTFYEAVSHLKKDSLWTEARDVFFMNCEPLWIEFLGVASAKNRPVPFVDACPVSIWIYLKPKTSANLSASSGELSSERPRRTLLRDFYQENETHSASKLESSSSGEAEMHLLVQVPSLVSVQLNHYQYLFLMRQIEVMAELSSFLTYDSDKINTHHKDARGLSSDVVPGSMVIAAVVPQVDVSFLMPCPNPCKDTSALDLESFMPDSSSTTDLPEWTSPVCEVRESMSEHNINANNGNGDTCSITSDMTKSHSESQIASPSLSPPLPMDTPITSAAKVQPSSSPPTTTANGTLTPSKHPQGLAASRQLLASGITNITDKVSGTHHLHGTGPLVQLNLQDNINASFTTVRKGLTSGFTSFMSTLESAVKTSPEDMSDTMSVRSDLSSDSDNFIMVNMETDRTDSGLGGMDAALFRVADKPSASVEVASEVFEEATPSEVSLSSSIKRKDSISVVTFKLGRIQFVQQSRGFTSIIKLQAGHMVCEECTSMAFDEFQRKSREKSVRLKTKFSSRSRGWSDSVSSGDACCLKVRLETHEANESEETLPKPSSSSEEAKSILPVVTRAKLEGKLSDFNLSLYMSTVTGLLDMIEDEIIPQPMPMKVVIERVSLRLTEDRIPANITSPGPVASEVRIPCLLVERDLSGLFSLLPYIPESTTSDVATSPSYPDSQFLIVEENQRLRAERDHLVNELKEARQLLADAQKEKQSLEEAMRVLQEVELTTGGKAKAHPTIGN